MLGLRKQYTPRPNVGPLMSTLGIGELINTSEFSSATMSVPASKGSRPSQHFGNIIFVVLCRQHCLFQW